MSATTGHIPSEAEFAALEGAILDRAAKVDRNRRRRNVGIGAAVAAAAVLTGTGAVLLANTEMRELTTYCYGSADLGSLHTQVGTPTEIRDDSGRAIPAAVADAVDKCAAVWRIGFFAHDGVPVDDGRVYDVPDLQLCVRPDGVSAVLPRGDDTGTDSAFCSGLGLSAP